MKAKKDLDKLGVAEAAPFVNGASEKCESYDSSFIPVTTLQAAALMILKGLEDSENQHRFDIMAKNYSEDDDDFCGVTIEDIDIDDDSLPTTENIDDILAVAQEIKYWAPFEVWTTYPIDMVWLASELKRLNTQVLGAAELLIQE